MWYPKNALDLEDSLHTEKDCRDLLFKIRWPTGFVCPKCGHEKFWETSRGLFKCRDCLRESSVTAGTIFDGSHLPLRTWLRGLWWLISEKQGTNASAVQQNLGLGSYRTAWLMLHKLRKAMVTIDRTKLNGEVEFDSFYLGGKTKGYKKGAYENKLYLAIGVEVKGSSCGRARLLPIKSMNTQGVVNAVEKLVEPGAVIITDGFKGFEQVKEKGYRHKSYPPKKRKTEDYEMDCHLPRVHRVISLLKRWQLGTLHGRMSKKHSESYLEEFVFRFNRRTSKSRGLLFLRVLQNGILLNTTTYPDLIK